MDLDALDRQEEVVNMWGRSRMCHVSSRQQEASKIRRTS